MDHLTIVIRPFRVEAVLAVIDAFGVDSCMLREAKGYGRQKGYLDRYRGEDFSEVYLPKVEVSVVVVAERSADLAEQLTKAARTGRIGDGKVLVVRSPYPPIEF
jgi:nitrogen regulatory protein PII